MAIQSFSVGQVLTAAQVNALQVNDYNQTVSNKTASYTLVAADKGTRITMSSTSATTITVNDSLFSAGDTLFIQNLNSGVSTITAGTATVTTSASLALAQWEGGTLYFTSASAAIFFKSDGAAASGGGLTLISETVASANSSLSFTGIAGSYKQLLLVWHGITHSTTGSRFIIRFNNSSGAYGGSAISALGGTTIGRGYNHNAVELDGSPNSAPFGVSANFSASDQNAHANGQLLLDNYASATKYKGFYSTWGYYNNSAAVYTSAKVDAYFLSTSAITSIDIVRVDGSATFSNATNTTIRLYGVS
jgi:hypothetical protein